MVNECKRFIGIMGNRESHSELTVKDLQDYMELTYLTKSEILHAFSRFKNVCPNEISFNKFARIPFSVIKTMPELQCNPFVDRIGKVFSSGDDENWSFEDFLDMVSIFSEKTSNKKKAEYAFRIYDFDEDGFLSHSDLNKMIYQLVGPKSLRSDEIAELGAKILKEADIDNDGMLSLEEFKHCVMKIPQFCSSFTIRM